MTLDLAPVDERLAWAADHAERVRRLSEDWARRAIRTTTTLDPDRSVRVYRAEVLGEPATDIALALGDTLHQARATLDNLVGILRGGATGRSAFPIETDPAVYDRDPRGRLEGVPPWALAVIRSFQPFADTPLRFVGESLAALHHLAIADRHRALLLSGAVIDLEETGAGSSEPGRVHFDLIDSGRVLTVEYPAEAEVSVHTAAAVLVAEPRLRWPDGWHPPFPSASEVAQEMVRAVGQVVDAVRASAPR